MTASRCRYSKARPTITPSSAAWLDEIGLERTSVTVIPSLDKNPLSDDPAARKAAVDYLDWCLECSEALGSHLICGPIHQTLGHFTGNGPTDVEKARGRDFHRADRRHRKKRNVARGGRGGEPLRMLLRQHDGRPRRLSRHGRSSG